MGFCDILVTFLDFVFSPFVIRCAISRMQCMPRELDVCAAPLAALAQNAQICGRIPQH